MTDDALGLSDVLAKIRRADESLTEFVAPVWPGVARAAVWMEGKPRLFGLDDAPTDAGFYLLGTDTQARVLRPAEPSEVRRFLDFLGKASVILLDDAFAFPASFAERLQGITGPRPIHFAEGEPLAKVQARFDGINLFFDGGTAAKSDNPLAGLFGESSIFSPGELLGVPGTSAAGDEAEAARAKLQANPDAAVELRLRMVLGPAGATLDTWRRDGDTLVVVWQQDGQSHTVTLRNADSPITSGICLPGSRGFDLGALTRLLLDHALDAWR